MHHVIDKLVDALRIEAPDPTPGGRMLVAAKALDGLPGLAEALGRLEALLQIGEHPFGGLRRSAHPRPASMVPRSPRQHEERNARRYERVKKG